MQTGYQSSYTFARRKRSADNYSDPSLPNYRPEWWRASAAHWDRTLDWTGFLEDPAFKDCYLCTVPGELSEDRMARLQSDSPEPFFKDAVKDHASIFSQFDLAEDAPALLVENDDNVDLAGTDIWQWAGESMRALFRDGGALLGADMPPAVSENDLRLDRRPRLLWVPLRDCYWPEYRNYGGVSQLAKIAIRRAQTRTDKDSALKAYNEYWVYELDEQRRCTITQWEELGEGEQGTAKFTQGETRLIVGADGLPFNRLPFTDKFCFLGDLNLSEERQIMSPFADLLNLNIQHYNARSEYNSVKRKTALPTVIRYWAGGPPDVIPAFYAGSGRTQDYDADSRVEYLELRGDSMPELRADIDKLEAKIAARDNKLFAAGGNRSATEAEIENQKAKVGYPGVKMLIESAFQDLFTIFERFANPSPDTVGGIVINESVLKAPASAQDLQALFSTIPLGNSIEAIVRKAVRDGHYEPEDFEGTPFEAVLRGESLVIPTIPVDETEVIQ